jgi:hypothetical protein
MVEFRGTKLTIRYCEQPPGGEEPATWWPPSWHEALSHIPAGKHKNINAAMAARVQTLANEGRLRSPDYFNTEGELPDGSRFYAIKVGKVRAYGWYSNRHKGIFFVSHFAFKKGQKLSSKDTNEVVRNWRAEERA